MKENSASHFFVVPLLKTGPGETYEADLIKIPHHKLMTSATTFWHAEFLYSLVKFWVDVRFKHKVKGPLMFGFKKVVQTTYICFTYILYAQCQREGRGPCMVSDFGFVFNLCFFIFNLTPYEVWYTTLIFKFLK